MKAVNKFLFVLCTLLICGVTNVWGNTWTGNVAVGSGKGSATVKVYKYPLGIKTESGSATSSDATLQTATTDGWSSTDGCVEFTSNAATGYTFYAWYSDKGCKNDENKNATYTKGKNKGENTTRYAKFTPNNYTVNFDGNKGTPSSSSKSVTYDATYGTLPSASRTGYTLVGWFTDATGGTQITPSTKVEITAAQTLYAHWRANSYNVTLDPNGGMPNQTQTVTATYDAAMPTGSIAARTKTGYTFAGYFTKTSGGTQYYNADLSSARTWNFASTKTLYAHWTANDYTVNFNGNGGTPSSSSKSVTYDATYGTLPSASRTGYTFVGWFTDATNGTQINPSTKVQITATQTLYAHWTANNYRITLDNQSATTPGTASVDVTYDSNVNLTIGITPPTKTNYTFEGYYTAVNGGGTMRIDKNGAWQAATGFIENGVWKNAGNVTLYAYWKHNQTITWDFIENAEYTAGTAFNATASSNLAVYYTSSDEDVAKIVDGNKLLVVTPNVEVTITAHQDGNHDWNAAPEVTKTFTTLGATPNDWSAVSATGITYGQALSASTLSGAVKVNGVTIAGTLTWIEPTTQPNAGSNQPFAVRFTPDNQAAYGPVEFNVNVNVAKATPVFTWNISNILRENVRYSNFVTSTNTESAISSYASPSTYVTASGVTLTTGEVDAIVKDIKIIVLQGTTDNFVAKNETLMVSIYPKSGACLPFEPINETQYNNAKVAQDGNVNWYNTNDDGSRENYIAHIDVSYTQRVGIGLGSWEDGLSGLPEAIANWVLGKSASFDYSAKSIDLFFSGVPDQISFDVESQAVTSTPPTVTWPATAKNWHLYESVDGVNFGSPIAEFTSDDGSVSRSLNENSRYVRIVYTGNFTGFVKNLRITHKKSLTTDKSSLTFGTEDHPLQEPQTINVSYSSLGVCGGLDDAITVTSSNPAFYVDETTITENVGLELKGEYTVRVRCNDVNQSGKITFTSNDGTTKSVNVSSYKPSITKASTTIFQTGTEHAPLASTPYRARRTHNFSACFNSGSPIFDTLYIYGVTESGATNRLWSYDAVKGYKVPAVDVETGNIHTPCFVYAKNGDKYDYVRTFAAATTTLNIAPANKKLGFVGYKPASMATAIPAVQLSGDATVYLDNTEIIASDAVFALKGNVALKANGKNVLSSNAATIKLATTTSQLTIEDNWTGDATSAVLALRPTTGKPSIDLGSASGRVNVNGTQLELHNATNMAIVHMEGATEKFDGEVYINDGSIGGEATLGMPKATFIDGGTFNDGTVVAYTLKGMPKRPRNSRGEMLSRHTMSKAALEAYDWYGQAHLTPDASLKMNPMLMDEEVWIFNGAAGESYDEAMSWNKDGVPGEDDDVLINAPMVISVGEMKANSITINWEDKGKGIPAVTVNPDGGLTVGEGGVDALKVVNMVENLVLKAGQAGELEGQTGYIRIHPESAEPIPAATVELYSTAYYDMSVSNHNQTGEWQFVGYPMRDGASAKTVFNKSFLYDWNTTTNAWVNNRKTCVLQPFQGYATSQYRNEDGWLITFSGELVENKDTVLNLVYNEGSEFTHNMIANSYAAPIDIANFDDKDFSGIQAAVYIFNTGSREDIKKLGEMRSGSYNIAGQYLTIPIGSARDMKDAFSTPTVIAPMQGFCVHATAKDAFLRLNYESLVWNALNKNTPLHAPSRYTEEQVGSLCVSLYSEGVADNLYMLESDKYGVAFENGYDAMKMNSGEANIFSVVDEDQLAVNATNNLIGTQIGVRTGDTTAYVMTFTHLHSERMLALLDIETNQQVDIFEGTEYAFFAMPNSEIKGRFYIVESANVPVVTTGIEETNKVEKVHKFIKDNQLYILKNGVLYNAVGARVH